MNPIYLVILLISVLLNGYFISKYTEEVESTAYIEENISYIPRLNAKTAISSISQDIENNMFEMLSLKQYHESVKLLINADSNDAKITHSL